MNETKYLIFDSETTGLVHHKKSYKEPNQPYLVQLGCCLVDETFKEMSALSIIVNTCGNIHPRATEVHGITQQRTKNFGVNILQVLALFNNLVKKADIIVAHNLAFDLVLMQAELYRNGYSEEAEKLETKESLCTMLELTNICKLPGRYGKYKWPKLEEAYKMLIDPEGFENAHDALVDVRATIPLLKYLIEGKNKE